MTPSEQSDSGAMTPDPERTATWRDYKYGQYRSEGKNIRAYIVGRREGRRFLRVLWQAKRSYRK